jgi:phosphocarrier protein FPr
MVGIVVVSHSRRLAEAAVALSLEMVHGAPPEIAIAAGLDADTFGTDAMEVKGAIESVDSVDGVVVIMDLGSAVLSTEMALDLLDPEVSARVSLSVAPFVEGLVAAVVQAAAGATREEVAAEADGGLAGKTAHLGQVAEEQRPEDDSSATVSASFQVANPHGLHARPAARLVAEVKRFDARAKLRNVTTGAGPVPAGSLSRVAAIGATKDHRVEISASGRQAAELVEAVLTLAARRFDEVQPATDLSPGYETPGPQGASPGIAIGPKFSLSAMPIIVDPVPAEDPAAEWRKLLEALAAVRTEIARVRLRVAHEVGESDATIFDAHLMLLEDRELLDSIRAAVDGGSSAAAAWNTAMSGVESEWAALSDPYLNARAADVRAVGDQVLRAILGITSSGSTQSGVLVAEELTPAETADLDPERVLGIVTGYGSATSHSAILARSLGIPAVVGAGRWILDIPEGVTVVVDGADGTIIADPSEDVLASYLASSLEATERTEALQLYALQPAVTSDGVEIEVVANVGSPAGAEAAIRAGADGVGLLRTEFMFLGRRSAPDIDEQERVYGQIAETLAGRKLTIRTLDVGGDKPLHYAPTPVEANPFLGVRGLRLSLRNPGVLHEQLVAVCRVAADHPVAVMFPMVSVLDDVTAARAALDKAAAEVGIDSDRIEMGIMVEVPSAALNAPNLAPHVDFFSIGTNDLTQYTLAAERGNERVADLADPLDPAVLRLIDMVCRAGKAHHVKVAVCGEVAADPLAVPVLAGLGVGELSVSPPAVAEVKETIRGWAIDQMRDLAAEALTAPTAASVRALVEAQSRA